MDGLLWEIISVSGCMQHPPRNQITTVQNVPGKSTDHTWQTAPGSSDLTFILTLVMLRVFKSFTILATFWIWAISIMYNDPSSPAPALFPSVLFWRVNVILYMRLPLASTCFCSVLWMLLLFLTVVAFFGNNLFKHLLPRVKILLCGLVFGAGKKKLKFLIHSHLNSRMNVFSVGSIFFCVNVHLTIG